MFNRESRKLRRKAIHSRIRSKVAGTAERPRLAFFKSANHVYAQLIDDEKGHTLASASTRSKSLRGKVPKGGSVAAAKAIGEAIAELAREHKIEAVVFDRSGFLYQ